MFSEFITMHREAIIAKTRLKVSTRAWPPASTVELENGVPLFLTQLAETLRFEGTPTPFSPTAIGASATQHGGDLLALGFTVSQVVHDYGDICQAVTELADELGVPITASEFHILNRSLDTAIAEAVTEHARITAAAALSEELERTGHLMHELRNKLNTSLFAFDVLKRGTVGIGGSTGAVLGRSLVAMRTFVDNSRADIRSAASHQRPEVVSMLDFLNDVVLASRLHADYSGLTLIIEPIEPDLAAHIDAQLLESALMNLLTNAFKYTREGGSVTLRPARRAANSRSRFRISAAASRRRTGIRSHPLAIVAARTAPASGSASRSHARPCARRTATSPSATFPGKAASLRSKSRSWAQHRRRLPSFPRESGGVLSMPDPAAR